MRRVSIEIEQARRKGDVGKGKHGVPDAGVGDNLFDRWTAPRISRAHGYQQINKIRREGGVLEGDSHRLVQSLKFDYLIHCHKQRKNITWKAMFFSFSNFWGHIVSTANKCCSHSN